MRCSWSSIPGPCGRKEHHTYDTLIDAHPQGLQGIDEALLVCHGLVAEAADVVLVQSQHGKTFADTPCQLQVCKTSMGSVIVVLPSE